MSEHKHHPAAGQQATQHDANAATKQSVAGWPRFRCHKVVSALKIGHVEGHKIWPADGDLEPIICTPPMFARGKPVEGDYLVEYEGDGYRSFSPGSVFEAGYSLVTGMDFGDAIRALRHGRRVARAGWNGKGMWLGLQVPDAHSKMGLPYLYMRVVTGELVPWLASQTDMLADDWSVVED